MIPDVLMDYALSLDGRGYVGQVTRCRPPKITTRVRRVRAAGMDGTVPIDIGVEDMSMSMNLTGPSPDALSLWGIVEGGEVSATLRGSLRNANGAERPALLTVRCLITTVDPGDWTPGEETPTDVMAEVTYLRWTDDGTDIIEIDIPGNVRRVRGVDQRAARRANLGL